MAQCIFNSLKRFNSIRVICLWIGLVILVCVCFCMQHTRTADWICAKLIVIIWENIMLMLFGEFNWKLNFKVNLSNLLWWALWRSFVYKFDMLLIANNPCRMTRICLHMTDFMYIAVISLVNVLVKWYANWSCIFSSLCMFTSRRPKFKVQTHLSVLAYRCFYS